MEIGAHIKGLRAGLDLSQDDLAARVYVSRQTVSSWENDKTYPDLQSLLLLSEIFGVTVDSLIKGDVDTMLKTIDSDIRLINILTIAYVAFMALTLACLAWFGLQLIAWKWELAQMIPTCVLVLTFFAGALGAAMGAGHLKQKNDLVTFQEIIAFMKGDDVDRDTPYGRRIRTAPAGAKALRTASACLVSACAGAVVGILAIKLFMTIL